MGDTAVASMVANQSERAAHVLLHMEITTPVNIGLGAGSCAGLVWWFDEATAPPCAGL